MDKMVPECEVSAPDAKVYPQSCLNKQDADLLTLEEDKTKSKPFELYKRRTSVVVGRKVFLDVVGEALSEYKYVGPNQRADLVLACR